MSALLQYARQEPSADDQKAVRNTAVQFVTRKSRGDLIATLILLMLENMRLTAEVNDHRQARGFEPLPTHDAKIKTS